MDSGAEKTFVGPKGPQKVFGIDRSRFKAKTRNINHRTQKVQFFRFFTSDGQTLEKIEIFKTG